MIGPYRGLQDAATPGAQAQPSVSAYIEDFNACHQRFIAYLEKLQQLTHKIEGPRPTPVGTNATEKDADNLLARLSGSRRTYGLLLDEFERLLGSLENSL